MLDGERLVNADEDDRKVIAGWPGLAGLSARMAVLVRGIAHGPRFEQLSAVARYRLRQAPRDVARLGWFFLRGHGRWIVKGWTWATHGDLRADARAPGWLEISKPAAPRRKPFGPMLRPAG
jgi:S-DNA-T family DNA segregation ATPase FtsK/SpoIIIE